MESKNLKHLAIEHLLKSWKNTAASFIWPKDEKEYFNKRIIWIWVQYFYYIKNGFCLNSKVYWLITVDELFFNECTPNYPYHMPHMICDIDFVTQLSCYHLDHILPINSEKTKHDRYWPPQEAQDRPVLDTHSRLISDSMHTFFIWKLRMFL